jgi:hypothetical protein
MQSAAWVPLLKLVPPELQDNLNLVTTAQREIAVQWFAQFADDYLVLRGRLGGTTDQDRVFVVPYDQICYLGFSRPVKDEVLQRIFGELLPPPVPVAAAPPPRPVEEVPQPAAAPEPTPPPAPEVAPEPTMVQLPAKNPVAPTMPDKAALLQRIRQRTQTTTPTPEK